MKLPDVKFPIPQEILTTSIKSLAELALRLQIEASVYQQMNTHEGRLLADDRLTQASEVKEAYEYLLSL